jgi:phospholipid transport system substrate-binding protein
LTVRRATALGAVVLVLARASGADAPGPLAVTRDVLGRSNAIVRGAGDQKTKLVALSALMREFLDTEALARVAAGTHLEGRSDAQVQEFLRLFHDFFVRTYVQRLLLFDGPEFVFGAERTTGDEAQVATEVVTTGDRFAVDYTLARRGDGWRATDIRVEGISLARNFRSQFDAAVARDSFDGLLDRLRAKSGDGARRDGT